ncbi:MAG: deacetylase [Burkholderiales bacterium]|jgi:hypothetical protein
MRETPFIITIDTEGDNLWGRPRDICTRNTEFLPRFQSLCERFRFKPVYLTNYEMAISDAYVEFARDALSRDACEIGMHLHAWNSPPIQPLTDDDFFYQPYLIEYPDRVMKEKIHVMTALLEDKFARKMISHRAGRWGFDERYAAMLLQEGYLVDCSVTPGVDWSANPGDPNGKGGSNYETFPDHPYFLDLADISAPAPCGLLEVPMTIFPSNLYRRASYLYRVPLLRRAANRLSPGLSWLCPVQPSLSAPLARNLDVMLKMARATRNEGVSCMEFMIHSSELMPGGSPNFATPSDIDLLYDRLETLFEQLSTWCYGLTLHEFRDLWLQLSGHTGMRAFADHQPDQTGASTVAAQFRPRSIPVGKQAVPE